MGSGARTGVPLCAGLIGGVVLSLLLFPTDYVDNPCQQSLPPAEAIDSSEHWKVVVQKPPPGPVNPEAPKVVRARFAATELGIRERLAVFILAESSLGAALNASLGPHVPRVHVFADASRVDTELAQLPNLSPYRANGQHAHMHILNAIFNLTMHESFDWFMLVRDSTYVNPFALVRLIDSISWSKPIALGASDQSGRCKIDAGIVLSNPAMQILVQQRHLCNAIVASSDELALEQCVAMATNLSCEEGNEEGRFLWWNGVTQASELVLSHSSRMALPHLTKHCRGGARDPVSTPLSLSRAFFLTPMHMLFTSTSSMWKWQKSLRKYECWNEKWRS